MNKKPLLPVRKFTSILLIVFVPLLVDAQILPKGGSQLNYRLVGFSFPPVSAVSKYTIEIAAGTISTENSFEKSIIKTVVAKNARAIAEVPSFGAQYTWRIVYSRSGSTTNSELHHFGTSTIPKVDTNKMRLRIIKPTGKYKGSYVFLDGNKVLYDMTGNPVWYLPDIDSLLNEKYDNSDFVRDLKLSNRGTVTVLIGKNAYEINYNGTVLWKGPYDSRVSTENEEFFHHDLIRLANGHYMVLGGEFLPDTQPLASNSTKSAEATISQKAKSNISFQKMTFFGTIIEYDLDNNVVWSWKSSKYYKEIAPGHHASPDGEKTIDTHENAFFFDEKKNIIYISFKNVNRIVKIKYPTGAILNAYGNEYPDDKNKANELFCEQHSCKLSKKGDLMLYNNNACNHSVVPTLAIFHEPVSKNENLEKVWEYICSSEVTRAKIKQTSYGTKGGNVSELENGDIFASMCSPYSNVFVVNHDKKITWNAIPEQWDPEKNIWQPIAQYRASIITSRKEMEKFIFSAHIK